MADETTLLVRLKTIVDNNAFTKNLKEMGGKVRDAVAVSPIKKDDLATSSTEDKKTGKKSGFAVNMLKHLKGVLLTGGKILGIATIISVVLEPAMKMLDGIGKMLKEFFRPISDMLMTLVMPLMIMLRPIVQTFRVLMMPFRQAAMEGLAAANLLISQGMQMKIDGHEGGGDLISAGFKGAMSSAGLLMTGFLNVIMTPFKNIGALGIGRAITNTLADWESMAINGVLTVKGQAGIFRDMMNVVGNDVTKITRDNIVYAFKQVENIVDDLETHIGGFSITNFKTNWDTVQNMSDIVFNPLLKELSGEEGLAEAIETTGTILQNFKDTYPSVVAAFETEAVNVFERILDSLDFDIKGSPFDSTIDGLVKDLEALNALEPRGIFDSIKSFFTGTNYGYSAKQIEGLKDQVVRDYMDMFPEVGQYQKAGLRMMLRDMDLYFGHSLVPDAFRNGLKNMEKSTKTFVESLKSAGNSIESIARSAAASAAKAASAARSAESSARSASRARSSILI